MKRAAILLLVGILAGAASWFLVGIVSDKFEPFDSGPGLVAGQFLLSLVALYVGYKTTIVPLLVYILGAYLGMNLYAYLFGGSEHQAWALLGLIMTAFLVLIPLSFGAVGMLASILRRKLAKGDR